MATPRSKKPVAPGQPAPARKPPARGRARLQQNSAVESRTTQPDEDIEAQQHEIHGMIEDAMEPQPERGGTDIERE